MNKINSKTCLFLAGCCLFLLIGIGGVKSVSVNMIKQAFIGSAFSFRINEAIELACPDLEIDNAIELQRLVENHPQLNRIIHRYLRAYAAWFDKDQSALDHIDNEKTFARLNQNILKETKKRNPSSELAVSEEKFMRCLADAEEEVEFILRNQVPQNLQNFGKLTVPAIKLYSLLTSFWLQAALILALLLMLLLSMITYLQPMPSLPASLSETAALASLLFTAGMREFYRSLGKLFLRHGCFWATVPYVFTRLAGLWLSYIVDRLLGRHMSLDCTPFVWRGGILIVLGLLILIITAKLPSTD